MNGYRGLQVRDSINAIDLMSAFWQVYKNKIKQPGKAYNIGAGRKGSNSILEAITQAEKLLGKKANIEFSTVARRGDHKWCIYSSSEFKKDYPEWKIEYDINRTMKELCERHRQI